METSFATRRYGKPIPVARHIGLQSYRNAALLSLAQAARATISVMFKGFPVQGRGANVLPPGR
jgi:hypothetical protein